MLFFRHTIQELDSLLGNCRAAADAAGGATLPARSAATEAAAQNMDIEAVPAVAEAAGKAAAVGR